VIKVLLLQVFWFSFVLVGLALFLLYRRFYAKHSTYSSFYKFLKETHKGIAFLLAFVTGIGILAPVVALFYIFEWQLNYLSDIYLIFLIVSIFVITLNFKFLSKQLGSSLRHPSKRWLLNGGLVAAALIFDYVVSIKTGSPLDNDVPLHLAKIQLFLNQAHLTLADPFVGYNGILDLRYSTNLLSALQAIIAHLLQWPAYKVWFYSYAFYRLIIWTSLFALFRMFLPKARKEWAYMILILCPFVYTGYFFSYAELPHCIVLAWICLLLVGLKLLFERGSFYVLLLSALLIATTHALASSICIVFLVLLIAIINLKKRTASIKKQNLTIIATILVLSLAAIANLIYPDRTTEIYPNAQTMGPGLHSLALFNYKWGPIVLPNLIKSFHANYSLFAVSTFSFLIAIVLLGAVIFLNRIKQTIIKKGALILITTIGLSIFNALYVSVVGYIFLAHQIKDRRSKILVILAIVFFAIIAYDPITLTLVHNHFPLWTIARFEDFNTFAYIAPILGLLVIYSSLVKYWGFNKLAGGYLLIPLILVVGLFNKNSFPVSTSNILNFNNQQQSLVSLQYSQLAQYDSFNSYLKDQVVFTNDPTISQTLPIETTGKYVGFIFAPLASQAENYNLREQCQETLFKHLNLNDLEAAKVTQVVLAPGNDDGTPYWSGILSFTGGNQPQKIAAQRPYLKFETRIDGDSLYAVKTDSKDKKISTSSTCDIPYRQ
jgi:hypothetical protein